LNAALKQQGVNPATLKTRIRADLVWAKIVRADARSAVNVTERDVLNAIGKGDGEQANGKTELEEYTLQPILFVVPKKRIAADGTLVSNDVAASGVYHKLGYRGCPIVQLSIGDKNDCRGSLLS